MSRPTSHEAPAPLRWRILSSSRTTRAVVLSALAACSSHPDASSAPPPPSAPAVSSISITPQDDTVTLGTHGKLTAAVRDMASNLIASPAIAWSSDDPGIVTVTSEGTLEGVSRGNTTVRASSGGKTASANVHVIPVPIALVYIAPGTVSLAPGAQRQLTAVALDARQLPLDGRTVAWSSNDVSVASVDSHGFVTAHANGRAVITARIDDSVATAGVTVTTATSNVTVSLVQVYQNTLTLTNGVPLVAARPTLVRVWVTGTPSSQGSVPVVLRIYRHGLLEQSLDAVTPTTLPNQVGDLPLSQSVNFLLPATLDLTDVSLQAMVDPSDMLAESDEFDNVFPLTGRIALSAPVTPGTLALTLMPIGTGVGVDPVVPDGSESAYATTFTQYLPIPATARVHGPLSYPIRDSGVTAQTLLQQVEAVRVAEGGSTHYYGLINVTSGNMLGIGGIGYQPGLSAVGIADPNSYVIAHEVGHNLSLGHAPCGNPQQLDTQYPYLDGSIGAGGYDARTATWYAASTHDIMSYCTPNWISAYNESKALQYWSMHFSGLRQMQPSGPGVLIWGKVAPSGDVVLNPLYALTVAVPEPQSPASGTVTGYDAQGGVVFASPVALHSVADAASEGHFALAVPLSEVDQQRLARVSVEFNGRTAERRASTSAALRQRPPVTVSAQRTASWDAGYAGAMLRDPVSGEVLGFGQHGVSLPASSHALELVLSDGLHSQRIAVTPP